MVFNFATLPNKQCESVYGQREEVNQSVQVFQSASTTLPQSGWFFFFYLSQDNKEYTVH